MLKLIALSLFLTTLNAFATNIMINSPLDGWDLRQETVLNVNFTVNQLDEADAKIVLFKLNNNAWPKVNEVPLPKDSRGDLVWNIMPAIYFCDDLYAIRIMSGSRTLAGPVHFKAGVGACGHSDKNTFVNLENNLIDILNFKPANQGNRDTCGSFASAAALSAAYRRLKGQNVLLSQNYIHHIIKSSGLNATPVYLYENQSSFWGGNSVKDALSHLKYYQVPNEVYAPYQMQGDLNTLAINLGITDLMWNEDPRINRVTQESIDLLEYNTQHIPLFARQMAIYGVESYRIHIGDEAKDTNRIENYLKAGQEVIVGLPLKWKAVYNKAKTFLYDANSSGGGHMMLIVGFDKTDAANPFFLIKNSWGDGILRVHYDFIRKQVSPHIGVIDSVRDPAAPNPSRWIGRWEMKHDRWRGQLFLRRALEVTTNRFSGYLRLGEYHHQNGKRHCVYGAWDPNYKMLMMKINFNNTIEDKEFSVTYNPKLPAVKVTAKDVCPEAASGQYFELNMASNTHRNAYGRAVWNGIDFPAEIWRE